MATIICNHQNGYKWIEKNGCHFKGYLQTPQGSIVKGDEAISLISSLDSYDDFINLCRAHYGVFAVIVERGEEIWLGTDIARSMPIYYSDDFEYISDDVDEIVKRKQYIPDNVMRLLEMYTTSFVGFDNTVYEGIKQVELGCTAKLCADTITENPYYIHGHCKVEQRKDAVGTLETISDKMIRRLILAADGRQIVLSLSGGYDSRYVACSLKKNGVENVFCYTYGRKGSYEVIQSKKVADALGYKWYNVEYDDDSVKAILSKNNKYLEYANRPDYMVYVQNYLAVKALIEEHLIDSNAVFITGLCNDMPTGFYIPTREKVEKFGYTIEGVVDYVNSARFVKFELRQSAKGFFNKELKEYLEKMDISVSDYQSFISALDCVETAEFHSKCYLNMNEVHDFFGHEWLLPCWDRELLDYWYSLPAEYRINQKTYEEYIIGRLAVPYGVNTKKKINVSARTPLMRKIKRIVGSVIVRIAYPLGIPMRRNTDINNMSVLELELYKQIVQKKAIKADRAALILLLTIFMMERRYGTSWFANVRKYLA